MITIWALANWLAFTMVKTDHGHLLVTAGFWPVVGGTWREVASPSLVAPDTMTVLLSKRIANPCCSWYVRTVCKKTSFVHDLVGPERRGDLCPLLQPGWTEKRDPPSRRRFLDCIREAALFSFSQSIAFLRIYCPMELYNTLLGRFKI